jgi:hypothetical protein
MHAMPAYPDTQATRESLADAYDAIRDVVRLCLDGEAKGDAAKLREAFHQDARMFGDLAGTLYDAPIQTLFDMAAEGPVDTGNYRSRILSITQLGDVGDCRRLTPTGPVISGTGPRGAAPLVIASQIP